MQIPVDDKRQHCACKAAAMHTGSAPGTNFTGKQNCIGNRPVLSDVAVLQLPDTAVSRLTDGGKQFGHIAVFQCLRHLVHQAVFLEKVFGTQRRTVTHGALNLFVSFEKFHFVHFGKTLLAEVVCHLFHFGGNGGVAVGEGGMTLSRVHDYKIYAV